MLWLWDEWPTNHIQKLRLFQSHLTAKNPEVLGDLLAMSHHPPKSEMIHKARNAYKEGFKKMCL